jgi:hypothetical protein
MNMCKIPQNFFEIPVISSVATLGVGYLQGFQYISHVASNTQDDR